MKQEDFVIAPAFSFNALHPYITAENIEIHFLKHHMGYWNKLKSLLQNSNSNSSLEAVIEHYQNDKSKKGKTILNNSLQIYNHNFFWQCLKSPHPISKPSLKLERILEDINFKENFINVSQGVFGSGWSWLIWNGKFKFISTSNAMRPKGKHILCLDLWEHSYYLSQGWQRNKYINEFLDHLVNYEFMEKNMQNFI